MFLHIKEVNLFFSHTGEDILLNGVLKNKPYGFYIDIGAYDPIHYSNTYLFFVRGWNGINIDANPDFIKKFNQSRPKDINISAGVSDKPGELIYYQYKNGVFNTFSKEKMKQYGHPIKKTKINVLRLDNILDNYLPKGTIIDFMNVDVEGFDLRVLKSNNWKKYRPNIIAVESDKPDIDKFLKSHGYKLSCSTIMTKIFVNTKV